MAQKTRATAMRNIYLPHRVFRGRSRPGSRNSAPEHMRNSGTAHRSSELQKRFAVHAAEPKAQLNPPTAVAWMSTVPKMATVRTRSRSS